MIGLETTVALVKTHLIDKGYLSWADAITKMSIVPARIFGLPGGSLTIGHPADITIIDPEKKWTVKADKFYSRSRNSPFIGRRLNGQVSHTVLGGRVVFNGYGSTGIQLAGGGSADGKKCLCRFCQ